MKIKLCSFLTVSFLIVSFLFSFTSNAQVVAGFTASPVSGCPPVNVSFTNTSTGATSYIWDFGNGNTSSVANPGAIFSNSGTFTITLTAINGGTSDVFTSTINVFQIPIASFTTSAMPSCSGQAVNFTDNSSIGSAALSSWAWDFGDGNAQNTPVGAVSHTYLTANTFPVTLIVTDANGCSNSVIKTVTIISPPVASFSASTISACSPPLLVDFTSTSTSTGTVSFAWDFGDGNISALENPSNTYNNLGTYTVTLTVSQGGCSDIEVKTNYIGIQNLVANFSANNLIVCAGDPVSFSDLSFPLSVNQSWDFGDGTNSTATNPIHSYAAAGTYSVTLIEGTTGCTNTAVKNNYITVTSSPTVAFSADQTQSCSLPLLVNFSNTSSAGSSYSWDFGDGSPAFSTNSLANFTHLYTTPGSQSVKLTATSGNGCSTILEKIDYIVLPSPVADFSANVVQGCVPLTVDFSSISSSPFDPIVSYSWNFGNATTGTSAPLVSTDYLSLGSFTVTLIIETSIGCKDTLEKTNYIETGTKPTANFSIVDPTVCYGTNAEFTDLSIGADSAYWEFDVNQGSFTTPPGATLPFNPVTNLFPDTGTFYVTQIAFNNGCSDTLKIDDIVTILPPKPLFSVNLSCDNLYSASFTDESLGADSLVWDFGDGSPIVSNDTAPIHLFATRGPKIVELTAYNFLTGCFNSVVQNFQITEPHADFNTVPPIGCYPLPVTYTNISQDDNFIVWDFGDGSPLLTQNSPTSPFTHTTALPNLDTVTLVITDVNGCKDTATKTLTVYGPLPDFSAIDVSGCTPFLVTLTDASITDSALVQWTWNFGDGTPTQTIASPSVSHTYNTTGFYAVTMTVTDKNGCIKTLTKPNYIIPTFPLPNIVADTFACIGELVVFNASASIVSPPSIFTWDFGDGSPTASGMILTHAYTTGNLYTVTLTLTDVNGCDSSIQHQIRIQQPLAAFSDSILKIECGVTDMQFTDNSTGLYIISWAWQFGDGASSTQQNPSHAYTVPGTYIVTLIITNNAGCTDTLSKNVAVPGPSGTFTFTPSAGCPPLTSTFTAVSATAISYTWDFGDGTILTTASPIIQHTYNQIITATPALLLGIILLDGSFCTVPAPPAGQITVVTVTPTVVISGNPTFGCVPLVINFTDNSTLPGTIPGDTLSNWLWNFGDGTSSTLKNPTHVYNNTGLYPVTLSVSSMGGCKNDNSDSAIFITVHPDPVAVFSPNATSFDLPYDVVICDNQSVGAETYVWDFGDGFISTLEEPQHLYSLVGIFKIQLIAISEFGCRDTISNSILTKADVVFPNAFSPSSNSNSEGNYSFYSTDNDVFFPYTAGVVEYNFEIFNRWGEEVFESVDINKGWDGYYRGNLCENGVYAWKAFVKLNDGKVFIKSGDVTLIR